MSDEESEESTGEILSNIFDSISRLSKFTKCWNDDFCDRLNHQLTSAILMCMMVAVSYKQFVGEPIVCWCPGSWTEAMIYYAHQICWISNTYYLPRGVAPLTKEQPREKLLIYYQWVPFILLCQTMMFQLPNILWKSAGKFIGIDINRVVMTLTQVENLNPEVRDRTVKSLVKQIDRSLAISAWRSSGPFTRLLKRLNRHLCWIGCGRGLGNYLTTLYIVCKVLYLANAVSQIFLLNFLLGAEKMGFHFLLYGWQIGEMLLRGQDTQTETKIFPRVTMCDFTIRQMANFQDFTIECALPINLFNEKIFIFVWFWLVTLTVVNATSLAVWLGNLFAFSRISYVKKYLNIAEKMKRNSVDQKHVSCFAEEYLRQDGVFALRIIAKNTNDVIASEVVSKLWDNFLLHHQLSSEFHKRHSDRSLDDDEEKHLNEQEDRVTKRQNAAPSSYTDASGLSATSPTTPGNTFPH